MRARWLSVVPLALGLGAPSVAGDARALLPELIQEVPSQLTVEDRSTSSGPDFRLRFRSAVFNAGDGPLMVVGRRASRALATMTATQVVSLRDGRVRDYPRSGTLRFDTDRTHRHWHYLDFERYMLVQPSSGRTVARSNKAGFCLGDRYRISPAITTFPAFLLVSCDHGRPGVLSTGAGISVGFGDEYRSNVDGQYLDVTHLPAGRYALINRANPRRLLRERSYRNEIASLLMALSWPRGKAQVPRVHILMVCPAGSRQSACVGPLFEHGS